jgi:hypothetical protein
VLAVRKLAILSLIFASLVACAPFAFAQPNTDTAESTLREYVNARLRWAEWKDYSQFITWPDEPGWDCWWVTNAHHFGNAILHGSDLVVPVTYARLGRVAQVSNKKN